MGALSPLSITIRLDSPVPAYRQIADGIRAHCVARDLLPGTKLPPVRQLAASLGVHFNTVAEAYRALADEGWLRLERRNGATVEDRQMPRAPKASALLEDRSRLHHLVAELRSKGVPREWLRLQLIEIATSLETQSQ